MTRLLCALALLLVLPACVAAIGNTATGIGALPKSTAPLLEEKVEAARRVVELRQREMDRLRAATEAGTVDHGTMAGAEIAVEEARIRLLQFRAELTAIQERKDEKD